MTSADLQRVLEAASRSGVHAPERIVLDRAPAWLVGLLAQGDLRVGHFDRVLDGSAVRHIRRQHGDVEREARRGQIAVSDHDFKRLRLVLAEPHLIALGAINKRGLALVASARWDAQATLVAIEEVRPGTRTLAIASMRKYPGAIDATRLSATLDPHARSAPRDRYKIIENPASVTGNKGEIR